MIYTSGGGDWHRFGFPRKKRPFDSVILENGQADRILQDAKQFLNSSKWYMDSGIPYRRGYLFHGPVNPIAPPLSYFPKPFSYFLTIP